MYFESCADIAATRVSLPLGQNGSPDRDSGSLRRGCGRYIYIYIYIEREREIYIYIYVYIYVCVYIYIYITIIIIIIIIVIILIKAICAHMVSGILGAH